MEQILIPKEKDNNLTHYAKQIKCFSNDIQQSVNEAICKEFGLSDEEISFIEEYFLKQ